MSELDIPDLSALGVGGRATGAGALAIYWTMGPSIKAVGNVFGEWTEYRVRNLLRMGDKVSARQGKLVGDGKTLHPRVAKVLIEEASWISDNLHQEYLAGLLLDSRNADGDSDDASYYAGIVARLTTSQVRLHFGVYSAYAGTFSETQPARFNGGPEQLRDLDIAAPRESYAALLDIPDVAGHDAFPIAIHGLIQEGLIQECAPVNGPLHASHIATTPTLLGAILYHKVMSYTSVGIDTIRFARVELSRANPLSTFADLGSEYPKLEGARLLSDLEGGPLQ
jgi:hypothetical protein